MSIRIVLADDHKILRETLQASLEQESDLKVVGETGLGGELPALLAALHPDVVVLDIGLPDINGIEVAKGIAGEHPQVRVVALSGYTEKMFVDEMFKAGARAFVAKSAGAEELVLAIRAAAAGKVFLSPEVTHCMIRHVAPLARGDAPPPSVLSRREQEILRLVAGGMSSPEIAEALDISPATVDTHRRNIKQKLHLNSIAELTRYAIREGMVAVK